MQDGVGISSDAQVGDLSMDNLYPALVECFAVILCGYVAGRLGILPQSETKGLNTFVANFSLPSLIFLSIADLDLSSVNWTFLLAILIAKAIVFFGVAAITLLVSRPINLSRSGLFAIFCTQSNDFAIGYPILVALYEKTHPTYPSYLYLMAPISLVILNPLGFILMELGRNENSVADEGTNGAPEMRARVGGYQQQLKMVWQVIRGIITNPVVFMTALGIVGNLVFRHQLPLFLTGILTVFGTAFSGTALFLLGVRMVGKVHKLQGAALIVPALLIAVKLLALPLVTREVVSLLHAGVNANDTRDLSTFGFLYGTFPSAPGVFVFATQYGVEIDLVASAMVACTFVSAPLMFVSAKMITLSSMLPPDYMVQLNSFAFDIAIASGIASVWLMIAFFACGKVKRFPHRMTICLMISQLISSVGVILCHVMSREKKWHVWLQFAVFATGEMSSRLWTGFLALGLLLLQSRSLCSVVRLQPLFIVLSWGIPVLLVMAVLLYGEPADLNSHDPFSSLYGDMQAAISLAILLVSFLLTVISLALHQRYQRRFARYLLLVQDVSEQEQREILPSGRSNEHNFSPGMDNSINSTNQVVDIEEISSDHGRILQNVHSNSITRLPPCPGDLCPARFECNSSRRARCHQLVEDYHHQLAEEEEDRQTQRHEVALMVFSCSMFLGIAACTWRLVMDTLTGIYVELAFLDVSLNQGQGLVLLAIFGLHSKAMISPLLSRWNYLWQGPETEIQLPAWDRLEFETRHVCDQFITHHMDNCRAAIAKKIRWRFRIHKQCFRGSDLVDWVVTAELARSRTEAVAYCNHLVLGRVIRHLGSSQYFEDASQLYTFSPNPVESSAGPSTEEP